jgi:hypothetical protein
MRVVVRLLRFDQDVLNGVPTSLKRLPVGQSTAYRRKEIARASTK